MKNFGTTAGAMAAAATVLGCGQTQSLTQDDVSDVLSKAVSTAAKKLPPIFCLEPRVQPSFVASREQPGANGWTVLPGDPKSKFRLILGPKIGTIPEPARSGFPESGASGDCRHKLVFEEPGFHEIESPDETNIHATIFFYDPCPTCGASYAVGFVKRPGKSWEMDSQGITVTAVS